MFSGFIHIMLPAGAYLHILSFSSYANFLDVVLDNKERKSF